MTAPAAVSIDEARELSELRAYLGDGYEHGRLEAWEEQLDREFERIGDEDAFYRRSDGYLYNLTAFAVSQTKLPYLRDLTALVAPGARLLDYGCGIGSDGLALAEAGYTVAFADFDNPSTRYLRWRLERRGISARVYDLDAGPPPPGFDLAYAFDVLEHVHDPLATVVEMERLAGVVLVNLLESEAGETPLHHPLDLPALLARAAGGRPLHYRRYWQRSHLVAWGAAQVPGWRRTRARARLALARRRADAVDATA
jgi:SAM-dependent methyltransferase